MFCRLISVDFCVAFSFLLCVVYFIIKSIKYNDLFFPSLSQIVNPASRLEGDRQSDSGASTGSKMTIGRTSKAGLEADP